MHRCELVDLVIYQGGPSAKKRGTRVQRHIAPSKFNTSKLLFHLRRALTMPPKPKATLKAPAAPTSNALVPVGARHLSAKRQTKRDENGDKPTTARALVLRNGKHGARGTGEMILVTKLLGREKLDLLAEDLVEKSKAAIMNPFRLEHCLKIADSQCAAFLDDIVNLQDPNMFAAIMEAEWAARKPAKDSKPEPVKSASAMARVVATKIHNAYMLASAWKIVADTLHDLEDEGLTDLNVKTMLKNNESLRSKYLSLYHFVNILVKLTQERFSVLATTTPHYAPYFKIKRNEDEPDGPVDEYVFDWNALKAAGKSFLDSIILELCFPRAPYPMTVLYEILHDAVDESPKEAKPFPQALWDAVGDLSESVQLQALLETPLLGPDAAGWKELNPEKPPAYEQWLDAEYLSIEASENIANWKDIIFPLAKSKKRPILENMWKTINLNYKEVAGLDIDSLWQVQGALTRTPQWHAIYIPGRMLEYDSDDDASGPGFKGGKKPKKKLLAITNGEDSDDSMPELQSVSNSSDDDESDDSDSEEEDDDDDDDSEYDEEQEDEIRDLLREAMDTAHEGDLFDKSKGNNDIDPYLREGEDGGKGNAFLKLLGSLRGRVFNPSPKLKTKATPTPPQCENRFLRKTTTAPAPGPKSQKATVEEVEDEDDVVSTTPKKKKKKPKKKKKTATATEPGEEAAVSPASPTPAPKPSPAKSPVSNLAAQMSNISLLPVEQTVPQSARSYLKAENLLETKVKVKSRSETSLAAVPETEKKGFMSKFGFGKDKDKGKDAKKEGLKKPRNTWFSRLTKKSTTLMHQLLRTSEDETKGMAPMKWENFLKLMREMGFEYDPSTAGSSVRFDPPDPKDVSITFHRPHPDPTIHPMMLREFAKRLKNNYGWSEADFLRRLITLKSNLEHLSN
ncbi:hypothetical protein MVEN_00505800 [Mycena venus]|uniref:Uncharacterized protein n=1 Tax=Mycena venus TaxID=2733690 RepID=A0A8H6YPJ6_9AGAR|nr:hypothetical protein MVEN_00505800 [Mycena venus]